MSTYTYDSGNFPAFTYTPDYSTWTIARELPRRPGVGPWRYKRYRKFQPAPPMQVVDMSNIYDLQFSEFEAAAVTCTPGTSTIREIPREGCWRRLWDRLKGARR